MTDLYGMSLARPIIYALVAVAVAACLVMAGLIAYDRFAPEPEVRPYHEWGSR